MSLDWNRSYDGWKVQDSWQILIISSNNKIECMTIPLCGTMNMLSEIKCLKETVEASTIGIIRVNMKVEVANH